MVVTMHSCRGNFRSTFIAQGGYEHVAERLLGERRHRRLFPGIRHRSRRRLRAAALRAQGQRSRSCSAWSRRRAARWRKRTTSSGASTRRRNMSHSTSSACRPQCGFASTEEGNILAEDEQWAKLRMIVELADEVWGEVNVNSEWRIAAPAGCPRYSPILCKGSPRSPGQANQPTTWRKSCLQD